ncbi:MAG TPA: hypothetical protein VG123_31895, partial [Streptosporangiaceae bacterium]|nr:hypothetical protein [Streptosporangiaceae bacterium]
GDGVHGCRHLSEQQWQHPDARGTVLVSDSRTRSGRPGGGDLLARLRRPRPLELLVSEHGQPERSLPFAFATAESCDRDHDQ